MRKGDGVAMSSYFRGAIDHIGSLLDLKVYGILYPVNLPLETLHTRHSLPSPCQEHLRYQTSRQM